MVKNKVYSAGKGQSALGLTGMRVTSQRALILGVIRRGLGHLDADEIYCQVRKKEPRLSLSTVYRSLQAFKKMGLVEEAHFDESHHHYELRQTREHHHLVCLGCGQVIEFHHPISSYVMKNVAEAKDFEVVDTEFCMTGYCPQCRKERD